MPNLKLCGREKCRWELLITGVSPSFGNNAPIRMLGEVPDLILHLLLPVVLGFVLSRLAIYAWSRRTGGQVGSLSPNPTSVMIGMLFYVASVFYITMSGGVHTADAIISDILLSFMVTAPILLTVGPIFCIYILTGDPDERRFLSDKIIYAVCTLCLVGEIFWLGYALGG